MTSASVLETMAIARALGRAARDGDSIGLVGDLGAGKTHFVQALARGLGVPAEVRVTSPTFTLVNIHRGGRSVLVHVDLYRIERESELVELGLDELVGDAVVIVEWSDRFAVLPPDHLSIELEVTGETERRLTAVTSGPDALDLLERWQCALEATA